MITCGIDEAGRGPVLGPLVIAGACFEEKDLPELKKHNIKDSKLLTANQREKMYSEIVKIAKSYKIIKVEARELDSRSSVGININELEAIKCAELINSLKPELVYVDSPTSPKAERFAELIKPHLDAKVNPKIIAAHKADSKYIEVSAASILAKVTRDNEIEKIKKESGLDFGSGYPSDPITQKFVKEHWENKLAKYIRKSWSTIKKLMAEENQKNLSEF